MMKASRVAALSSIMAVFSGFGARSLYVTLRLSGSSSSTFLMPFAR
jgi:hypothetical protein